MAVSPSPKSHKCCVIVPVAVERSVKVVMLPRHAVSALKSAKGRAITVITLSFVDVQLDVFVAVSVTVYGPGPEKR